jgi:uncharacterized protein YdaU (DUF1376 family)
LTDRSPAFQFYPKDFLTDVKQIAMSLPEVGAYWRLCCHCWLGGSLPTDMRQLARLAGATNRQMREMWPAIGICFVEREGVLIHKRLEREREKQERFRRRQSDKGKASAAMRATLATARATEPQPESNRGSTTVQPEPQPKLNSPISYLQSPISRLQSETESEPLDLAWNTFTAEYPQDRVERGRIVLDGFIAACQEVGVAGVMQRLEAHKRSAQWRKGMVPKMGNYFGDKQLWRQALPEHDPGAAKPAVDVAALAMERIKANEARYGKR